jgi:hypothetical protein
MAEMNPLRRRMGADQGPNGADRADDPARSRDHLDQCVFGAGPDGGGDDDAGDAAGASCPAGEGTGLGSAGG